jgi:DNA-binding protein Fis
VKISGIQKNSSGLPEDLRAKLEYFVILYKDCHLYKDILGVVEKKLIELVLTRTDGNKLMTAQLLGINRNTLYARIKRLGINAKQFKK